MKGVFYNFGIILSALFLVTIITSCGGDESPSGGGSTEPEITSTKSGSGSVGTTVTISGSNFGATQSNNSVTFNGTEGTSADESRITTVVPDSAKSGPIAVSTGGQTATDRPLPPWIIGR